MIKLVGLWTFFFDGIAPKRKIYFIIPDDQFYAGTCLWMLMSVLHKNDFFLSIVGHRANFIYFFENHGKNKIHHKWLRASNHIILAHHYIQYVRFDDDSFHSEYMMIMFVMGDFSKDFTSIRDAL